MERLKKLKKPLLITLAVAGALALLAVLLGVLNAVLGNGEWTFFWKTYRYDDTGYTVGDGTVYSDTLKHLDVDWIDGSVEIVVCQDFYPSVSERITGDVTESRRMRFLVSEDGSTLSVKYRAPSSFLVGSEDKPKDLILRIPERMLSGMEELCVKTASAEISVDAIPFKTVRIEGNTGRIGLGINADTERVSVAAGSADVTLFVDDAPSLTLRYTTERGGVPMLDVPFERVGETFVCGAGEVSVDVETVSGELTVKKKR